MFKSMTSPTRGPWPYADRADRAGEISGVRKAWLRIASGIRSYRAALARKRRLRHDMAELEGLDDRMLRDIGVTRCEIGRVVRYGREL
jgi:uncharacterized protein YjiS (DUF1127 family)